MKRILLLLGLVISAQIFAVQQSDFEKAYYPVLNHFASVQMERNDFIAAQGDRDLTKAERKKLNAIDCALWQAEINYDQFVIQRFPEYIKFSGEQIDDIAVAKSLYQDDINALFDKINNACKK